MSKLRSPFCRFIGGRLLQMRRNHRKMHVLRARFLGLKIRVRRYIKHQKPYCARKRWWHFAPHYEKK